MTTHPVADAAEKPWNERQITTADFDPFEFTRIFHKIRGNHSAWLLVAGAAFAGLLLLGAASGGNIGTWQDFQLWTDLKRILGVPGTPASEPSFPLMRDATTWLLGLAVISGTVLLHRHWQYMSRCLSGLATSGAIIARPAIKSTRISRILRIDDIVAGTDNLEALNAFVKRVTDALSRHKTWFLVPMIVASFVLAILLVLGQENSLFQPVSPPGLSAAEREEWMRQAYQNWWAGQDNVTAYVLYLVLATLSIFLILTFQVIGIFAIYITIGMYFLIEPCADWLNRDGRYGWAPLAQFYRTVVWANALLGATLTVVLASLGVTNFDWVAALVVVYALLMPMFTLVPWMVFRRAEENAQRLRVAQIYMFVTTAGIDIYNDVERMAPFIAEIDRCRSVRIRPLRMGTVSLFTHLTLVILPVALAAAQILFPLQFGDR